MLGSETKQKIQNLRDTLVGKIPVPTEQVKQITLGLIYKFMSDIDQENKELGSKSFFSGDYEKYSWYKIMGRGLSSYDRVLLYSEGLEKMALNPNIPQLFRDIFKGAFLPFRDPAIVNEFLKGINEFKYEHSEDLGDAFEFLLMVMDAQGDAGQFRTPRHIIDFIVQAIDPQKTDKILDPACGTAGFLVGAYKHILKQNTASNSNRPGSALTTTQRNNLSKNFVGYDISHDMVRLSLVNMYLHQFSDPKIYEYDSLTSLDRWEDNFDCVLANPPFMTPRGGIRPHNRFAIRANRSEVLFVDYIAEHLTPSGKAGIIVPEGVIFQSVNAYKALRKMLVDNGYLYAVVSLPAGVFNPYSGVKTNILLIDKTLAKKTKDILFIKVKNDGFDLGAQRRPIEQNNLPQALEIIIKYKQALIENKEPIFMNIYKDYAHIAKKEKIAKNGEYFLSGDRHKEGVVSVGNKWPIVELGDIATVNAGNSAPQKTDCFENGTINFFRTSDVGQVHISNNLIYARDKVNQKAIEKLGIKIWPPKTILFPKSGASTFLNHRAMMGVEGCVSSHLATIIVEKEKIIPEFLFNLLIYVDAKKLTEDQNYPSLRLGDIEKIKIPLPPLEIQKQIVAQIEDKQKLIKKNKKLIDVLEQKIKDKIKEVWGE